MMRYSFKIKLLPPDIDNRVLEKSLNNLQTRAGLPDTSVKIFEDKLSNLIGSKYCLAVNSGTSALHLALILLNVQPGDEVICPTFTFAATANVIRYQQAVPVFVDSEEKTWNMCPELLEQSIEDRVKRGKKPKAAIVVHTYGMPAQIDKILDICNSYSIPIIEDAAGALGSVFKGEMVGSFGDLAAFSFNYNKIITTAGGGALMSDNSQLIKHGKHLATQAKSDETFYEHKEVGYNYIISGIASELGINQLNNFNEKIKIKSEIYLRYFSNLNNISGITFLSEERLYRSNKWLTTMLFNNKNVLDKVRLRLYKDHIETRPLWKPMHEQPIFSNFPVYLNGVSSWLFNHGLCLPSGTNLTQQDQNYIIDKILKVLNIIRA